MSTSSIKDIIRKCAIYVFNIIQDIPTENVLPKFYNMDLCNRLTYEWSWDEGHKVEKPIKDKFADPHDDKYIRTILCSHLWVKDPRFTIDYIYDKFLKICDEKLMKNWDERYVFTYHGLTMVTTIYRTEVMYHRFICITHDRSFLEHIIHAIAENHEYMIIFMTNSAFRILVEVGYIPKLYKKIGLKVEIPDPLGLSMEIALYLYHRRNPSLLNPESLIQILEQ
jgi:hypothetical protein